MNEQKIIYMKMALELAKKGAGFVSPNPLVGCVVIKDGKVIGRGHHEKVGQAHAEVNALKDLDPRDVENSEIYCTLEPCCHLNKRTPPCAQMISKLKPRKVILCNLDPNPEVAGKGVKILEEAGIEVEVGLLEEEGKELNEVFFKTISSSKSYITIKFAQTLDGYISTKTGDSKWISDELARKYVHQMRFEHDAILVGSNTLKNDNPSLDIRMGIDRKGKVPYRIIVGNPEKYNFNLKILSDENIDKTILITSNKNFKNDKFKIIYSEKNPRGEIDWDFVLKELYKYGIGSVLVEGGQQVISSLIDQKSFDKMYSFVTPKVLGSGISFYKKSQVSKMSEALSFKGFQTKKIGNQILCIFKRSDLI